MRKVSLRQTAAAMAVCLCSGWSVGQTLKPRPADTESKSNSPSTPEAAISEVTVATPIVEKEDVGDFTGQD